MKYKPLNINLCWDRLPVFFIFGRDDGAVLRKQPEIWNRMSSIWQGAETGVSPSVFTVSSSVPFTSSFPSL